MEYNEFKEEILNECNKMNIKLSDKQIMQFFKYMNELKIWNEKINLTAITDSRKVIKKHFIDSLTIQKYIKNGMRVIDIGSRSWISRFTNKNCK